MAEYGLGVVRVHISIIDSEEDEVALGHAADVKVCSYWFDPSSYGTIPVRGPMEGANPPPVRRVQGEQDQKHKPIVAGSNPAGDSSPWRNW